MTEYNREAAIEARLIRDGQLAMASGQVPTKDQLDAMARAEAERIRVKVEADRKARYEAGLEAFVETFDNTPFGTADVRAQEAWENEVVTYIDSLSPLEREAAERRWAKGDDPRPASMRTPNPDPLRSWVFN